MGGRETIRQCSALPAGSYAVSKTKATFREQWAAISAHLDFSESTAQIPAFDAVAALEDAARSAGWRKGLDALLNEQSGEVSPRLELIARAASTILDAQERHQRDSFSPRDVQVITAAVFQMMGISIAADQRARKAGSDAANRGKKARNAAKISEYCQFRKTRTRVNALKRMEQKHSNENGKPARGYSLENLQKIIPSDKKLGINKRKKSYSTNKTMTKC